MERRGITLLELLLVLVIISLFTAVIIPNVLNRINYSEGLQNFLRNALPTESEVCVNPKENTISVGDEEFEFKKNLVKGFSPGKLATDEFGGVVCVKGDSPQILGMLIEEGEDSFTGILISLPLGYVNFYRFDSAQSSTFQDNIMKGKPLEWLKNEEEKER